MAWYSYTYIYIYTYGGFQKWGYPHLSSHSSRIFHSKPSIWGTPIYGTPHIFIIDVAIASLTSNQLNIGYPKNWFIIRIMCSYQNGLNWGPPLFSDPNHRLLLVYSTKFPCPIFEIHARHLSFLTEWNLQIQVQREHLGDTSHYIYIHNCIYPHSIPILSPLISN